MPPIEFCLAVPSRRAAPSVWTHLIIAGADLGADAVSALRSNPFVDSRGWRWKYARSRSAAEAAAIPGCSRDTLQ